MGQYFGADTPKLGFGLMRLPKGKDGKIDVEQVQEMVDLFMAAGLTYFDTAYVYDGGDSERAAKAALVDRGEITFTEKAANAAAAGAVV